MTGRLRLLMWAVAVILATAIHGTSAERTEVPFSDDFAVLRRGWGEPDAAASVNNGQMVIKLQKDQLYRNLYRTVPIEGDFDLRIDVVEGEGGPDSIGGAIFWAMDRNNCYAAGVNSSGNLVVLRYVDGVRLLVLPSTPIGALRQGVNKTNELRIVTLGKQLSFYVNGAWIASIRGFPPTKPSYVGVLAQSFDVPHTWMFANLSVERPAAPVAEDANVLLAENFSVLDPAWGPPNLVRSARNQRFIFEVETGKSNRALYSGRFFDKIDAQLTITEASGEADAFGGIVFWAVDPKNYALAAVRNDGTLRIGRFIDGKPKLSSMPPNTNFKPGLGQNNILRVITGDDQTQIWLNGKRVADYDQKAPQRGWQIGLFAEGSDKSGHTWEFSNLIVRRVPE